MTTTHINPVTFAEQAPEEALLDWLAAALKDFTICWVQNTWQVIGHGLAGSTGYVRIINTCNADRRAALVEAVRQLVDYRDAQRRRHEATATA